jgi:signal transduction histidine kinase
MGVRIELQAVAQIIRGARDTDSLPQLLLANLTALLQALDGDHGAFTSDRGDAFGCQRERGPGEAPEAVHPTAPHPDLVRFLQHTPEALQILDHAAASPSRGAVRKEGAAWRLDPAAATPPEPLNPHLEALLAAMRRTGYGSAVIFPLRLAAGHHGWLQILTRRREPWDQGGVHAFGVLAEAFGFAYTTWQQQAALQERIKELTCLYRIAHLADDPHKPLDHFFREAAARISSAWLYPEDARGRIVYNGDSVCESGFPDHRPVLSAPIRIHGQVRGAVEVAYASEKPLLDEGPFLKEERRLLDTIARELTWILERRLSEEEKEGVARQLHHSNRLNIVGQLSASVAHEINEPLTSILGFAQLALKAPDLPPTVRADLDQIVATALHSRDIVRRLLVFSRHMPVQKMTIQLDDVVGESIGMFRNLCSRDRIDLRFEPSGSLPPMMADPGQIRQVVSNLLLNAIQAMGDGGTLSVQTRALDDGVELAVGDTGCGMPPEIKDKIFIPFFTTKAAGQGTGLGLAVVNEIVRSHGGTIRVDSQPGKGTLFQVYLPAAQGQALQGRHGDGF